MSTTTITESHSDHQATQISTQNYPKPLLLTGALDGFKHEDLTPVIGREYADVNLVDDIINAKNADELLRDLAITSESDVVKIQGFNSLTFF